MVRYQWTSVKSIDTSVKKGEIIYLISGKERTSSLQSPVSLDQALPDNNTDESRDFPSKYNLEFKVNIYTSPLIPGHVEVILKGDRGTVVSQVERYKI